MSQTSHWKSILRCLEYIKQSLYLSPKEPDLQGPFVNYRQLEVANMTTHITLLAVINLIEQAIFLL